MDLLPAVVVDAEDIDLLRDMRWYIANTGYATHSTWDAKAKRRGSVLLHRLIAGRMLGRALERGEEVDHISGDRLENRRCNLRVVSHQNNMRNQGKHKNGRYRFIGVCRHRDKWMAYVYYGRKFFSIGHFEDEVEAAWMRDQLALALRGEFARLNFSYEPVSGGQDV